MNPRVHLVLRSAASLAAALFLASGCGTDDGSGLFTGSSASGTTTATGSGGGVGGETGTSSATSMTTGSMATGTGGGSSTASGTGGAGGSCQQAPWYCDGDQDGHGDPNVSEMACSAPPGGDAKCPGPYLASNDDCGPGDAMAYPGQMQFFGNPIMPPAPNLVFDYNCDGMEEKDPAQLFKGGMSLTCSSMDCFLNPNSPKGFGPNAQCGGKMEYYQCAIGTCALIMAMAPEPLRCR